MRKVTQGTNTKCGENNDHGDRHRSQRSRHIDYEDPKRRPSRGSILSASQCSRVGVEPLVQWPPAPGDSQRRERETARALIAKMCLLASGRSSSGTISSTSRPGRPAVPDRSSPTSGINRVDFRIELGLERFQRAVIALQRLDRLDQRAVTLERLRDLLRLDVEVLGQQPVADRCDRLGRARRLAPRWRGRTRCRLPSSGC